MKYLALLFTICSIMCQSQTWQTTSLSSNINGQRYDDVFFIDDNTGWAANGFYASVYKTTDGGITWTEQLNESNLGNDYYFRNIEFLNNDIGFLGTLNGAFFKTIDGGDSWTLVNNISPNPIALCGLTTTSNSTVFGCGAYFTPAFIIKSTDSGNTWSYQDMSAQATALVEIYFTNENIGYACGQSTNGACILKTEDGGLTWNEIYNTNNAGEYVWKIQGFKNDPNILFASVEAVSPNPGKLLKSMDSGLTWTSYDAPETDIQAVGFIDENRGWMGGHNTGFYETNDGGQSWNNINIGSNLNRIFIVSPTKAYASGTSIYKFTSESLSLHDFDKKNASRLDIKILKNPIKSELEFRIKFTNPDNILIELYDSKGQFIRRLQRESIFESNIDKTYNFDLSNLASGTYILNFHNNFMRESFKFIKE